jgi:predicted metal-dependent peptidase
MGQKHKPEDAEARIIKARVQLILNHPFFGVLATRLILKEDHSCKTMWVDGKHLGYNPKFVAEQSDGQLQGVVCHEVLHVAGGHPWRRQGRNPDTWNEACDYAVNPIVREAGYILPDGGLEDPQYAGLPAEAIYGKLAKKQDDKPESKPGPSPETQKAPMKGGQTNDKGEKGDNPDSGDGEGEGDKGQGKDKGDNQDDKGSGEGESEGESSGDGKDANGKPSPAGEVRDAPADEPELEENWRSAVIQAAKAAKMQGKLPGGLARFADMGLEPRVDWREALREFTQRVWAATDYTWRRPNARYINQGLYLPRLDGEAMPCIAFGIDTSGSVDDVLLSQFKAEVVAIVDEMQPEEAYIVFCDAKVHRVETLGKGDEPEFLPAGGGGTSFVPVFDWFEANDINPTCMIYLTDLYGAFPKEAPDYPVLWAHTQVHGPAPWGEMVEVV